MLALETRSARQTAESGEWASVRQTSAEYNSRSENLRHHFVMDLLL